MSQTTNPAPGYLEHFTARVLADALAEATVNYWVTRAEVFEHAAHRPGVDWPGQATPEQVEAQQARCRSNALACRRRAAMVVLYGIGDAADLEDFRGDHQEWVS